MRVSLLHSRQADQACCLLYRFVGIGLFALFAVVPCAAQTVPDNPQGLAFRPAGETNLAEILTHRRETLEKRQGTPLKGHQWWLWGLGTLDFDRDGDLDLIVCVHGATTGLIIRNQLVETGELTFVDATESLGVDGLVPATDNYPLVWDFDGDGLLDIAGLLDDCPTPCLLNRKGKRFAKAPFSLHPINYPDAVRDLNGDSFVDIAQTIKGKRVAFHFDPGTQSFTKSVSEAKSLPTLPAALQTEIEVLRERKNNRFLKLKFIPADLNGDGRQDLVVRAFGSYSGDRRGWYLLAEKEQGFVDHTQASGLPTEGAPLLIEDMDQDGDVDVLIASGESGGLYLNDGRGQFAAQSGPLSEFVRRRCPYLHVAKRADLDHDGDLDLAISSRRTGRQMVFENRGAGVFTPALSARGWDADPLVVRDIDNDGRLDVLVGGANGKESIGIYLNATQAIGNGCRLYVRMPRPNVYAVGARVELFRQNTLGANDARPIRIDDAPVDGTAIHLGLGPATAFDLRVTFPTGEQFQQAAIPATPELVVTPRGISNSAPK